MNTETELTEFAIQLSPEKTLEIVSRIASGLLASGHFTREHDDDDEYGEEQVIRYRRINDAGKPRYSTAVVSAAFDILDSMQAQLEEEINEHITDRILIPEQKKSA